jgi:hypothetical protein
LCTAVRRLSASALPRMNVRTPEEIVSGTTPDISSSIIFDWYQMVYHCSPTVDFPHEHKFLGRWLGIAETSVDELAYFILTSTGKFLTRKSVWALKSDELRDPVVQHKLASYDVVTYHL